MAEKEKIQEVPEGWIETPLSSVAESKKFAIVDGPFGTQLHADEYSEEGVPVVRIVNLSFQGAFNNKDIKFISERKADILKRSRVVPGDIIIAKTGATIGKTALFPTDYNRGIIASSCLKISFKKEKASSKFFLYLLVSPRGQKNIIDGAGGSTRTTINIKPFSSIKFTIPESFPEQSKIASILSTCDEAIETTDTKIEKLKRIKQGLMQDLFRFGIDENCKMRNEATHRFKDSPLGRIPEEWEVKRIVECAKVKGGKRLPNGHTLKDFQTHYPYIRVIDFRNNSVFQKNLEYLTKDTHRLIARYVISKNDIYISIAGTIGLVGIIPNILDGANLTENAAKITEINQNIDQCFLMYFLDSERVKHQIASLIGITTQPKLALEKIEVIIVSLPKKTEQSRIASVLSSADEAIEKEEAYKNKLLAIKRGLMADLLSGKVRVNKLIREAA